MMVLPARSMTSAPSGMVISSVGPMAANLPLVMIRVPRSIFVAGDGDEVGVGEGDGLGCGDCGAHRQEYSSDQCCAANAMSVGMANSQQDAPWL